MPRPKGGYSEQPTREQQRDSFKRPFCAQNDPFAAQKALRSPFQWGTRDNDIDSISHHHLLEVVSEASRPPGSVHGPKRKSYRA